ncbi:MAG: alpha/beta hydrolase, partial [Mycobacteriaceae bacterium]|nr:alpha/beta hydrolase [Mycobacteriaceae bacterium]
LTLREGNRRALGLRMGQIVPGEDAALIDRVRVPTLVLWGGKDRLIPPVVADEFTRRIGGSRKLVFPELGHVPHEEDPARTLAPVREFLQALSR